jgi:tRNA modification GTPase
VGVSTVLVNKSDRRAVITPEKLRKKFGGGFRVVQTSAKKKTGLDELKAATLALVANASMEGRGAGLVTNNRHIECLTRALKNLNRVLNGAGKGNTEEAIAVDLRDAVRELGAITGEDAGEEVLSSIFRQFCIGK